MECTNIVFTQHAFVRMFARAISPQKVKKAVLLGEKIESYPDDEPYPSKLILHREREQVLHVVVGFYDKTGSCYIITVYRPDPALWSDDFKTRRSK